jgi:hypothetical protein
MIDAQEGDQVVAWINGFRVEFEKPWPAVLCAFGVHPRHLGHEYAVFVRRFGSSCESVDMAQVAWMWLWKKHPRVRPLLVGNFVDDADADATTDAERGA